MLLKNIYIATLDERLHLTFVKLH